jgi:hypothetical protein
MREEKEMQCRVKLDLENLADLGVPERLEEPVGGSNAATSPPIQRNSEV